MKSDSLPKDFPANPAAWEKLIAEAPGPDRAPTPEESAAWAGAFVSHGLPELRAELAKRRGRGPNRAPTKERVTLRLSPEVVRFFKDSGAGWQTRVDGALREWVKTHEA
jgi:uncharacterized protein (DUF4415 family)